MVLTHKIYAILHGFCKIFQPVHCALQTKCSQSCDGSFPSEWKSAVVIPVFKNGCRPEPGNCGPIALLPIISKVMERIVHNRLSHFLSPWMNVNQSGFRRKDGTVPQPVRLCQQWSEAIDASHYVGVLFFDLKRPSIECGTEAFLQSSTLSALVAQHTPGSPVFSRIINKLRWWTALNLRSPKFVLECPREQFSARSFFRYL